MRRLRAQRDDGVKPRPLPSLAEAEVIWLIFRKTIEFLHIAALFDLSGDRVEHFGGLDTDWLFYHFSDQQGIAP